MSDNNIITVSSKQEFIVNVQKWVTIDSQLKIVNEKTKQMRPNRAESTSTESSQTAQRSPVGAFRIEPHRTEPSRLSNRPLRIRNVSNRPELRIGGFYFVLISDKQI